MPKLTRYLFQRNKRPLLPGGYHVYGDARPATDDERKVIARRLARTPQAARLLIDEYGSVEAVIRNVPRMERKKPPVLRRLKRWVLFWFPGG